MIQRPLFTKRKAPRNQRIDTMNLEAAQRIVAAGASVYGEGLVAWAQRALERESKANSKGDSHTRKREVG